MAMHAVGKDMVSPKIIIRRGEDIEAAAESLYKILSEKFKDNNDAANFFYELAKEEKQHKEFLRFSLSMIGRLPETLIPDTGIEGVLDKALITLRALQREAESDGITLKRAFEIAYEVENMVFESEYMEIAALNFSSLKNKFVEILSDTQRHRGAVLTFASKMGFDMSFAGNSGQRTERSAV